MMRHGIESRRSGQSRRVGRSLQQAGLSLGLGLVGAWGCHTAAIAHGVSMDYQYTTAVEIAVAFDTGEPMTQAQILVYAPDNPSEPWLKGETDDQGRFTFTPDTSQPGEWEVVFRQAGHGDIVRIPVSATQTASLSSTTALPTWQRVVLGGAVIWGFVGTALFFSRGK